MNHFKLHKKLLIIALISTMGLTACGSEANTDDIEQDSDIAAIEAAVKEGEQKHSDNQKRYQEAVSAYESGDTAKAKEVLVKLIEAEPENALYTYAYGNVLIKEKDYESAKLQYDKTIKLQPSLIEAYNNAAGICMLDGSLDQAQGYVQSALEIRPNDSELLFKSGQLYFATADYKKSIEIFDQIPDESRSFEIYRFLGLDKAYLGDAEGAMKEFKNYLDLAPDKAPTKQTVQSMYETLKAGGHLTPPEAK